MPPSGVQGAAVSSGGVKSAKVEESHDQTAEQRKPASLIQHPGLPGAPLANILTAQARQLHEDEDSLLKVQSKETETKRAAGKADAGQKEKEKEKDKEKEGKAPLPQQQRQVVRGGSAPEAKSPEKEPQPPASAARVETLKKFAEQTLGKQETGRTAPQVAPSQGQPASTAPASNQANPAPAAQSQPTTVAPTVAQPNQASQVTRDEALVRGDAAPTPAATETVSDSRSASKEPKEAKKETETSKTEQVRPDKPERVMTYVKESVEKGEDWTGIRRSTGYQAAKHELDSRQHATVNRETPAQQERPEMKQSQNSAGSGDKDQGKGQDQRQEQRDSGKEQPRERRQSNDEGNHQRHERGERDQQQQQQQHKRRQPEEESQVETDKSSSDNAAAREEAADRQAGKSCRQCGQLLVGLGICPTCSHTPR
ncbi:hypothetical protein IV102_35900 [bacterium]|nr:hypothetical protein [bacterium]